jgi:hypothetical protein
MSNTFGVHLEELKPILTPTTSMTSTPLRRIKELCSNRAVEYRRSSEEYNLILAMAFENIAIYCDTEMDNEKQMLIDICNDCAKDLMNGNLAVGKSAGEQLYKKKYL